MQNVDAICTSDGVCKMYEQFNKSKVSKIASKEAPTNASKSFNAAFIDSLYDV